MGFVTCLFAGLTARPVHAHHQGLAVTPVKDSNMTERFSQYLRRQSEPTWSAAVGHRFVT
ncbi:TenA family transcriptional regulator, partial [Pseudomonas kurunegalensis]|nr:TenA family transcriptional regulator [Pseudomonas kurunegalensis]